MGQAAVVCVVYPLVRLLARRRGWTRWGMRALSFDLVGAGAVWRLKRVAG